ncbi:type I restriction enzyme, S subunit [Corynebacterium appendicis CIP 107643]|uniref:Type I restriction enzyme, S subunit n=1 Tax=Corynebacterium appendicis CIP 107643 TaxID=1161099 RepID=A0A1N7JHR2_9CORY|nr:restriction endonuclease subunit S [Corynebacterium appendicis]WJY62012.1 Type I restriction modification DNA specificity domain protein [Corynebacterium appendicis CIP 107643]SIS48902.1 type I restriction enzyme, S subunit [Corynebacterium appendicis CIP 107643]
MNWVTKNLGDIVALQRGFDLAKSKRTPGPYPILSAGRQEGTHVNAKIEGPGFVIGRATNLGKPQWSESDYWPLNTTLFAKDFKGNNPRWLFHLFEVLDLTGYDSGSVQPMLNRNYIEKVPVRVPPRDVQDSIVEVLGSLDDKIAANQTTIRNGDALLLAHYKATPKCSTKPFEQICDVYGGSTPYTKRKEFWGGGIQWATPTDLTALRGPWLTGTERTITDAGLQSMSSALHPEGSILMTSRATIGSVALAAEPVATNQGFIVVRASEELTPWIFCQLQDRVREFEAWSNGATFLELSRGNFKKLPFHCTGPKALESFNQKAWPILQMCKAKQTENVSLAKTRDELLPLLMSGKITVREAEQEATAAGADIASEENEA